MANRPAAKPPARARGSVIVAASSRSSASSGAFSSCRWLRTSLWPSITTRRSWCQDGGMTDFAARIARAAADAADAGLAGILAAPGPDLLYLTGYTPNAVTERLTVLVVTPGRKPVLVLPGFERGDAE